MTIALIAWMACSCGFVAGMFLGSRSRHDEETVNAEAAWLSGWTAGIETARERERAAMDRAFNEAMRIVDQLGNEDLRRSFNARLHTSRARRIH